ncbi:Nardilysin [Echinococcus granulosus]|uniref:Nardilysin n=1 Tax=Echinococcus granulosus TaxID=6210 RepID=W6UKZ8_ECHGR|nr:Nardilysin [Echinococcus granulosus]EUB61748.1 Nardilysin [Echinococcus granulosus]
MTCLRSRSAALKFVASIVGYEGRGSLVAYLRKLNLAVELNAGCAVNDSTQHNQMTSIFGISVELSELGRAAPITVADHVFSYLHMLRDAANFSLANPSASTTPWGDRAFASLVPEFEKLWASNFRFQEPLEPSTNVRKVASAMRKFPHHEVFIADSLILQPDLKQANIHLVEDHMKALEGLTLNDVVVFVAAFLSRVYVKAFVYGNVPATYRKAALPACLSRLRVMNFDKTDVNTYLVLVSPLQGTPSHDLRYEVMNEVLESCLQESAFAYLRTRETLGYSVGLYSWSLSSTTGQCGLSLYVSSQANKFDSNVVAGRMYAFWYRIMPYMVFHLKEEAFRTSVREILPSECIGAMNTVDHWRWIGRNEAFRWRPWPGHLLNCRHNREGMRFHGVIVIVDELPQHSLHRGGCHYRRNAVVLDFKEDIEVHHWWNFHAN